MWIIFIILGVVLVWGLCKSGSRFSKPRAEDEETWEEPSGQPGKNSDDELEKIRRQVWEDHKRQEELRQKQLEKERMAPILEKQAALARQKELEDKYADSTLTREIIEAISDGTGRLPEEITIYNNHVTGRTNGQMRTFDFATNRVPFFKPSCFIPTNTDYHLLFGSKVALGNAINRILHEQYEVHDDHRHDADHRYNDNHEWVPVTRYTSNHVLLRLKATNHW